MAAEVEELNGELVEAGSLLRTTDPVAVVDEATRIANKLKDVLRQQGLTQSIQGRDYVKVEGWQTVGMMIGVTAACTDQEVFLDSEGNPGWKAHAKALQISTGQVIGEGDAICTKGETRWSRADDYAILSMAQTRAVSKVLRSVLAWIVTLAGYETTPAEEMSGLFERRDAGEEPTVEVKASDPEPTEAIASPAQRRLIFAKAKEKGLTEAQLKAIINDIANTTHTDRLPKAKVDQVLETIAMDTY
jgi:hypothetical protein